MELREHLYDIDDLWRLVCDSDDDKHYELIEGEIVEMAPPGWEHGTLAGEVYHCFRLFDPERKLGYPTVDSGFYPAADRSTLLSPDVAFTRIERAPKREFKKWAPLMPDIAVEVQSPSNTLADLRRKAAIYLEHGSQLVWIVIPDSKGVEVCRLDDNGDNAREFIGADGSLSGEDVLPGFELPLAALFA